MVELIGIENGVDAIVNTTKVLSVESVAAVEPLTILLSLVLFDTEPENTLAAVGALPNWPVSNLT